MPSLDGIASEDARDTDTRKLVILGLPWDTTETSLEQYFSQMGPLQVPLLPAFPPEPSCPPLPHGCTCGSTHVRCEDFPFPCIAAAQTHVSWSFWACPGTPQRPAWCRSTSQMGPCRCHRHQAMNCNCCMAFTVMQCPKTTLCCGLTAWHLLADFCSVHQCAGNFLDVHWEW